MAVRKIKLTIQYDGSSYHGWQIQPGFETVQETLNEAISSLIGRKVHVTGASRTDAGVSALGQVAVMEIDSPIPTENLAKAITDRLPPEISVIEAVEAEDKFDVIGDAKSKVYQYTVYNGPHRPILRIKHCWHIPDKLNIEQMNKAAQLLIGKKDFRSFASAADKREDSVRTISRCEVKAENDWVYIDVEGDRFLYNMVRNIVGTLVEVGVDRWPAEKIKETLEAKDRTAAGPIAPAQGLCLMRIKY